MDIPGVHLDLLHIDDHKITRKTRISMAPPSIIVKFPVSRAFIAAHAVGPDLLWRRAKRRLFSSACHNGLSVHRGVTVILLRLRYGSRRH